MCIYSHGVCPSGGGSFLHALSATPTRPPATWLHSLLIGVYYASTARLDLAATPRVCNAARLSCGDVPAGKRSRLCPLNPYSKIAEFNNQLGHFINALKQSPGTTKITHTPSLEVRHIARTWTTRQDLPMPE